MTYRYSEADVVATVHSGTQQLANMQLVELVWLVPLLPLLGFVFLMFFGRRLGEPVAGWVATAAMAGSFLASLVVFVGMIGLEGEERVVEFKLFDWVVAGE